MLRFERGPNRDKWLDHESSFMHLARSRPACRPIHSESGHQDLCRDEHVCQAMLRSGHGKPRKQRASRCANALHDKQTTRSGYELTLADGVIHMGHYDAVGWYDRPAKNGGAKVKYPARRFIGYQRHHDEQACSGSNRRPDDDAAPVEPVRKPADWPSHQEPAKGTARHEQGNSRGIETLSLRKDRAQGEERTCGHPAQGGGHESEGRLLIQPLQVDPDAPALMGWRHGLNQSDRHQGECDNDRDYAERSEARQVGRREKELSGDPTHQPRHGVDAQGSGPLQRC